MIMNTKTLECAITCDIQMSQCVLGVFPSDKMPKPQQRAYPFAFVVNTDKHTLPGKHWCVFFIISKYRCEFFDSYANEANYYSSYFRSYIEENKFIVNQNYKRLQSNTSNVCGHYCLYYLYNRCRNISLDKIVQPFSSSNFVNNDLFVYNFISYKFSECFQPMTTAQQRCSCID